MTIKNFLIFFFIILITIIIFYKLFRRSEIEKFKSGYISESSGEYNFLEDKPAVLYPYASKVMNIELKNNLLNPLNIIYNTYSYAQEYVAEKFMNIFPLKHKRINDNFMKALNIINRQDSNLLIINEDMYVNSFLGINNFEKRLKNIRFICSLYYAHLTLVIPLSSEIKTWNNLSNKIIGTLEKSQDLENLIQILSIIGYKKNEIQIFTSPDMDSLHKMFVNSQVDAIYLTTHHPSKFLKKVSSSIKIRFIFTDGIPQDKLKFHFPFAFKGTVDLRDYNLYPSKEPVKNTYATRIIIVTNYKTDKENIYNFVKSIFENIVYIRQNNQFLKNMIPSSISFCSPLLRYHEGSEIFYTENNYITYSTHQFCYLYTGSSECNTKLVNQNRFVNNFNNQDNLNQNYTILDSKGKWNNVVNNWDPDNDSGKRFIKTETYNNTPEKPLLISNINFDTETNKVYKNFIYQVKNSPDTIFPGL